MSIGAAFDAYIKAYLHERLFGKGNDSKFEFNSIFEEQVEPHNRDWALKHGAHVFNSYRKSGAFADLLLDMSTASGDPKFEMKIEGRIAHSACVGGINLLGKPDIWFINKFGAFIVYDWKVNGYMSKSVTSPKKGFVKSYDAHVDKPSRGVGQSHKDCQLMLVDGIYINIAHPLETVDEGWAGQTTIYSWILGAPVGSKFTVGIDQIVCKGSGSEFPYLRVVAHRSRVSQHWQERLHDTIAEIWKRVHWGAGFIFDDGEDESKARCELLDLVYQNYEDDHTHADWFNDMSRSHKNF